MLQAFNVFSALRYRDFRLYWSGLVAQVTGQQMMMVTMGWLAYEITGSALTLGVIHLLQALPRIALSMVGGSLADRVDQRKLIAGVEGVVAAILMTLAYLTLTNRVEVWHLGGAALIIGFLHSFDEPARQALFPHLLPDRSLIAKAVPLTSMAWQFNRIVAPAVAGFVIAAAGAGSSFFLASAGATLMVIMIRLIRVSYIAPEASRKRGMLRTMNDGFGYVWQHAPFRTIIGLFYGVGFFAVGFNFLMPVVAKDIYGLGPDALGPMYSAAGIGALVSLFTVAGLTRHIRPGYVILMGTGMAGGSLALFALTTWYPLALVLLFFTGYGQHLYMSAGQIVLQTTVPDEYRGRVMALNGLQWSFVPLGGAVLSAVVDFYGVRTGFLAAGLTVLSLTLLIALRSSVIRTMRLPEGASITHGRAGAR